MSGFFILFRKTYILSPTCLQSFCHCLPIILILFLFYCLPRVSPSLWRLAVDQSSTSWKLLCFAWGIRPGSPSLTCASSGEHILKGLPLSLSLHLLLLLSSPPVLLVSLLDLKSCPYAPSFMACLVRSVRLTGNCKIQSQYFMSWEATSDPQGRGTQRLLGFWKLRKRDLSPLPFPLGQRHTWDSQRFGKRDLSRGPANDSHICSGKERLTSSFPLWFGETIINRLKKELIDFKIRVPHLKIEFIMY